MEKILKRSMMKAKPGEGVPGVTVLAGVMSSFKQFERKLDKLADNVRWQGATLAELRALVTGAKAGPKRAVGVQCDASRLRRRIVVQSMGNPYLTAVGKPALRGTAVATWPSSPTSLPMSPSKLLPPRRAAMPTKRHHRHHSAALAKKAKGQKKNYKPHPQS